MPGKKTLITNYCESTLIHGYQFSWIREETQVCGFLNSIYTSMGFSFSFGNQNSWFGLSTETTKMGIPQTIVLSQYIFFKMTQPGIEPTLSQA